MSKQRYVSIVVLAAVFGMAGGMLSVQLFMGKAVFFEEDNPVNFDKTIQAGAIELVEAGQHFGRLAPGYLYLVDPYTQSVDPLGNKFDFDRFRVNTLGMGLQCKGTLVYTMSFEDPGIRLTLRSHGSRSPWPRSRIELKIDSNHNPSLELYDTKGKLRAALGAIELKDTHTGSVEKRPPSSLVLFGEDEKVMWSVP